MTWHRRIASALLLLTATFESTATRSEEIRFFDESGINYWAKPVPEADAVIAKTAPTGHEQTANESTFDWQKVMDPKNDDFFREGDYIPPAPFMEVTRNPSDQNIRLWQAYIARKNELAMRLQQRLLEYSAKNGGDQVQTPVPAVPAKVEETVEQDPKRFRFRMYFDSECPHCRRMMTTLTDLAQRGFFVEAMQVDDRPLLAKGEVFPVSRAEPGDVKRHGISSVPFLLIGDVKKEVVYKMTGFKTANEIFSEIAAGKRGAKP